jgi:hypothetical protein
VISCLAENFISMCIVLYHYVHSIPVHGLMRSALQKDQIALHVDDVLIVLTKLS